MTDKYNDIGYQREKAYRLERTLGELFDALDSFIMVLRFVLYVGSVLGAWFYVKDHALAVGIAASLTVAHLLIIAREYIAKKKKQIEDRP